MVFKEYIILVLLLISFTSYAQENLFAYSDNEEITVECIRDTTGVKITIYNRTDSIIYLFDSYFKGEFSYLKTNMYLHRYNKQNNTYKVSFLPFINSLLFSYPDYLTGREDVLIAGKYIPFQFTKIDAGGSCILYFSYEELFPNKYINDFDIFNTKKSSRKHKWFNISKLNDKNCKLLIEFAYYKDVSFLYKKEEFGLLNTLINKSLNFQEIEIKSCNINNIW